MINYKECMGCGGCAVICPVGAIYVELNNDGFYHAVVNDSLCINCGMCDKVCPMDNRDIHSTVNAYSYQSHKDETLEVSASGGFAHDVAYQMLKEKKKVCNVRYDIRLQKPIHLVNDSEEHLQETCNSIYLQSYSVDGFKEILEQKSGVVIGTPCQISTMHNILKMRGKRDDFILIDFFCHGVPSYNVWKKYLNDISEKIDIDNSSVKFRSKKYGWGSFTLELDDSQHKEYVDYVRNKNVFYKIFLENMATNNNCYSCPYYGGNSAADIRMGDFWGEKYKNDKKGVSALLVYSAKGEEIVKKMMDYGRVCSENRKEILEGQRGAVLNIPSCRKALLKSLRGKKTLKQINNTVIFRYKCLRRIKNIFVKE